MPRISTKKHSVLVIAAFLIIVFIQTCSAKCYFNHQDDRENWVKVNGWSYKAVHVLYQYGDYLYAGTDEGTFKTKNSGISWERAGCAGRSAVLFYSRGAYLYAVENGGFVFKSKDGGTSWNPAGARNVTS